MAYERSIVAVVEACFIILTP